MVDIKKTYEILKKKHALPKFEDLNNAFEISTIESDKFLLRAIRRKITELLSNYIKLLEEVLHPDTTLVALHEQRFFSDEERKKYLKLYRKLMIFDKKSIEIALLSDQKQDAEFINTLFKEWQDLKKELLKLVKKLQQCWQKEDVKIEDLGYFG